jgi:hypothetical protein
MAGISLAQAQTQLDAYLAAEAAIITGNQSYEFQGRRITRADLEKVQAGVDLWDRRVKDLSASASGRGRTVIARPR